MFLRAAFLLPATAVGLRLAGFRRFKSALERFGGVSRGSAAPAEEQLEQARQTARMVEAANRHGAGVFNCLQKSMVLWWLLRRQGIEGELRIGVRKQAEQFEAHAWVEHRGAPLNDAEDVHRHYTAFKGSLAATQVEPR